MQIVIAGGAGHLGRLLDRALSRQGHQVVVLSRDVRHGGRVAAWDGRTLGAWAREIDGADAVINLAGRSVNCRYTKAHLKEMMASRVESTRAIGRAIEQATQPPRVWLQMSTATIYAHRFDAANDELTGVMGGHEPNVPRYWRKSIAIARRWEETLFEAATPRTRRVAMRAAMVMSAEPGGAFDAFVGLARCGLGGPIAGGRQYISWLHDHDFTRAVLFLLARDDLAGPVNLAAPSPVPQRAFMAALRSACGMPVGLPASRWMAEVGAFLMRTDTELVLKSRRVVPTRLVEAGFTFDFPEWPAAAGDLVEQWRHVHK